jgi:hypothetical protein
VHLTNQFAPNFGKVPWDISRILTPRVKPTTNPLPKKAIATVSACNYAA